MQALEYRKWGNFVKVIEKAKLACELSENITYFAVQTRKQQITEEYFNSLDENKKD